MTYSAKLYFFLLAFFLGTLSLQAFKNEYYAQAQDTTPSLLVTVKPDRGILISLSDSSEFLTANPFLTAYVVYDSCSEGLTQEEMTARLLRENLCADSVMHISLSQPGGYDISPPENSTVIIGSCKEQAANCQEHPEEFEVLQIIEAAWNNPGNAAESELRISQIDHVE